MMCGIGWRLALPSGAVAMLSKMVSATVSGALRMLPRSQCLASGSPLTGVFSASLRSARRLTSTGMAAKKPSAAR